MKDGNKEMTGPTELEYSVVGGKVQHGGHEMPLRQERMETKDISTMLKKKK